MSMYRSAVFITLFNSTMCNSYQEQYLGLFHPVKRFFAQVLYISGELHVHLVIIHVQLTACG